MQTVGSVKKPMRWASGRWMASSVTSELVELRLLGRMVVVRADVAARVPPAQRRGRRLVAAAGAHVTRERLGLLDVDVRVAGQRDQVVGRVAGLVAAEPPVPRQRDLVDGAPVDDQRADALG